MKQIKSKYNLRSGATTNTVTKTNTTTKPNNNIKDNSLVPVPVHVPVAVPPNNHPSMGYWGKYMGNMGEILQVPVVCSYNAALYPDLLLNQPKIQVIVVIVVVVIVVVVVLL